MRIRPISRHRAPLIRLSLLAAAGSALGCDGPNGTAALASVVGARVDIASAALENPKPTIVLVHGAFADATGWQDLIPILQRDGYSVVAVQNPLSSLLDDIATTRRLIDAQPGAVVVVAHSYGGAVASGAAAGSAKVKALVFVSAYAPDGGESVGQLNSLYAPTALATALSVDAAGFAYIDTARYHDVFAQDIPERRTRVMAATQKPVAASSLGVPLPGTAAWRSVPSWFIVAANDHTISPDLERFEAKRMNARTTELQTSHLPFISRPNEVARVVREAAESIVP